MSFRSVLALQRTSLMVGSVGLPKPLSTSRLAPQMFRSFSSSGDGCGHSNKQLDAVQAYMKDLLGNTDPELNDVLSGNKKWVKETNEKDPSLFSEIGTKQSPHYLYIGCADARLDPTIMMGLRYGELFIHRNVGNVVAGSDYNLTTVMEFAINNLKIPHIIVCGHYDCGAVKAASSPNDHGTIEYWIRNIRDIRRLHADTLNAITDENEFHRKLVELNVIEQSRNVLKSGVVQRKRRESLEAGSDVALPLVHGLVFDPAVGLLTKLDIDWTEDEAASMDNIFNLYPENK